MTAISDCADAPSLGKLRRLGIAEEPVIESLVYVLCVTRQFMFTRSVEGVRGATLKSDRPVPVLRKRTSDAPRRKESAGPAHHASAASDESGSSPVSVSVRSTFGSSEPFDPSTAADPSSGYTAEREAVGVPKTPLPSDETSVALSSEFPLPKSIERPTVNDGQPILRESVRQENES